MTMLSASGPAAAPIERCVQLPAERVAATPLPTTEEEVWRYSRIGELDLDRFDAGPSSAERPVDGAGHGSGQRRRRSWSCSTTAGSTELRGRGAGA